MRSSSALIPVQEKNEEFLAGRRRPAEKPQTINAKFAPTNSEAVLPEKELKEMSSSARYTTCIVFSPHKTPDIVLTDAPKAGAPKEKGSKGGTSPMQPLVGNRYPVTPTALSARSW